MQKATTVGEKKLCPVCLDIGTEIEIHAEESTYQGNTKLTWKNSSGESHVKRAGVDGQGKPLFEHQTKAAKAQSIPSQEGHREATPEQLEFLKKIIERDDLFQAVAVSQVKKRGAELRGDIIAHEKEMLIRIRQLESLEGLVGDRRGM